MISVFGWPDPNTAFDQSEHALYTCYFIIYLAQFNVFWFRVIFVSTADQQSEECVKFLSALSSNGTSHTPDHREQK